MKRHGGFRSKTRHKLQKEVREKGKISISRYFQKFKEGDTVVFKGEPACQKGMYYPRFHGRTGLVMSQRGNCYEVLIQDGKKEKMVIVHPIHLLKK